MTMGTAPSDLLHLLDTVPIQKARVKHPLTCSGRLILTAAFHSRFFSDVRGAEPRDYSE
jgi:hypothetical protein